MVQGLGFLPPKTPSKGGFLVSFLLQLCCSLRHAAAVSILKILNFKKNRLEQRIGVAEASAGLHARMQSLAVCVSFGMVRNLSRCPPWSPNPARCLGPGPWSQSAPEELGLKRTQGPKARAPMFMVSGTLASLGFRI